MPSPKMQETRTVCIAMERAKQEQGAFAQKNFFGAAATQ